MLFLFFLFYITLALSRKLFSKIVEIQKVVEELRTDQKLMAEDISKLKISMAANDKEYIDVIFRKNICYKFFILFKKLRNNILNINKL
jgi:hypothetical protein